MNDDFSQRLFERIEQEQIRPISRRVVLARRILVWVLLALSVGCAAVLGSLLIMASLQVDLEFLRVSSFGPMLKLVLDYVPFFWVILFLLFCLMEVVLIRRETHAYRYSILMVAGFVVLGISLMGLGLYATRLPHRVEQTVQRRFPPPAWMMRRESQPRPEDGVLFGRVEEVATSTFRLLGPRMDRWEVRLGPKNPAHFPFLRVGQGVLVEGRVLRPGLFEAKDLRPHRKPPGPPPQTNGRSPDQPQRRELGLPN